MTDCATSQSRRSITSRCGDLLAELALATAYLGFTVQK
jgi:hypothetical protein